MNVVEGNLLIRASAGSGKTYQLGNRVIGRVAGGVEPEKIVALTFTRKAAGEFADSVLGKLAEAALDARAARRLADDLGRADADFEPVLRTIVRALPRFTLTTIDSFFTRVVRGFQYDLGLTGGRFELLEGPRAASARDLLLVDLLGRVLDDGAASGFASAFRRATAGREGVGVAEGLRGFIDTWHRRYCSGEPCEWGPDFLATVSPGDWEKQKHRLADAARSACGGIIESRKGQIDQVMRFIDGVEAYELGSGAFPDKNAVSKGILDALMERVFDNVELQFHKPFTLPAAGLEAISGLVALAAAAETTAAVMRTRAIAEVVAGYDALAESRLRRCGLLGFDDVKRLMGKWSRDEDARLRRELVDFRLDARYEHWLLDEFQDTSREEWTGLLPLLDEVVFYSGGSLFIVGDRKQAIYGWRGGDVSLFDEVQTRFGEGIQSIPMAESWRSCPEVLDLVNRVCGNAGLIQAMFGIRPERWQWDTHESAPPLCKPGFAGEACVEVIDVSENSDHESAGGESEETGGSSDDPRVLRMIERMREIGVGEKDLTCGVLVRRNADGRIMADALRAAGFDVVLDGVREPARDHPAGVVAWQLLRWLANPEDGYARRVIEMSPLGGLLRPSEDIAWFQIWESLLASAQVTGFSRVVEDVFRPLMTGLSDYGKRRLGEVIDALVAFDAGPDVGARAAARWIERLEVPQNPGAAAVQVMTIHKSKGLGFDVVFLPMLPDRRIPETQRFTMAKGDGWLSGVPPAWARRFFPAMREAEDKWADDEAYEALCQLYVALTRAKRGLYVYLAQKRGSSTVDAPTLTNWMLGALDADGSPGVAFQGGDPQWSQARGPRSGMGTDTTRATLGAAVPRRGRLRPSAQDLPASGEGEAWRSATPNLAGLEFGSEAHRCFEQIGWREDFDPAQLPDSDAGRLVASLMQVEEIAELFSRPSGDVSLRREQPVDAILGGRWLAGVIDRLHIHRDGAGGRVSRVEIIDFKTDAVAEARVLESRHGAQMRAYGQALATLYPDAEIELSMVSTALKRRVIVAL